jgi:argininosuccinate lyase
MKGQPLAYNKDNQEDKEPLFDAADTVIDTLAIFTELVPGISVHAERMREAATRGYSTATDLADYLVRLGLPFREAHEAVALVVRAAIDSGRDLTALKLSEIRQFAPKVSHLIGEDVFAVLALEGSVRSRQHLGGTAPTQVRVAISKARLRLGESPLQTL